jgi:uncharacterized membrane protein
MLIRFLLYGLLGWCAEVFWSAVAEKWEGRQQGWGLRGHSYLWSFPIYGLIAPLFEPLHDGIRLWPWLLRGTVYVLCIWAIEYITGWILKRTLGRCPWSYAHCRYHLNGIIRWDYFPLWFGFGMLLEFLHDRFLLLTPSIITVFSS